MTPQETTAITTAGAQLKALGEGLPQDSPVGQTIARLAEEFAALARDFGPQSA